MLCWCVCYVCLSLNFEWSDVLFCFVLLWWWSSPAAPFSIVCLLSSPSTPLLSHTLLSTQQYQRRVYNLKQQCSLLNIAVITLRLFVVEAMNTKKSSLPKEPRLSPSSSRMASSSRSILVPPWAITFPPELSKRSFASIPFSWGPWPVVLPTVPFGNAT